MGEVPRLQPVVHSGKGRDVDRRAFEQRNVCGTNSAEQLEHSAHASDHHERIPQGAAANQVCGDVGSGLFVKRQDGERVAPASERRARSDIAIPAFRMLRPRSEQRDLPR
jgi:hypothetical protein